MGVLLHSDTANIRPVFLSSRLLTYFNIIAALCMQKTCNWGQTPFARSYIYDAKCAKGVCPQLHVF